MSQHAERREAAVNREAVPAPAGVLFDAGGTLVKVNRDRLARGLERAGLRPTVDLDEAFWRTLVLLESEFAPAAVSQADWGQWWTRWKRRFGAEAGIDPVAFDEVYSDLDEDALLWDEPVPGALECVRRLRQAGVRVGVVSNADGRIDSALARAGLAERLELIVDSTVVGVAKPDPEIFDHALEPLQLDPGETWYLGDTVAYDVAAADAAGLVSWVIDHFGLQVVPHPRRVQRLEDFAERVFAAVDGR